MIKIYGKEACSDCVQAKKVCEVRGLEYEYLTLGVDYQLADLTEIVPGAVRRMPVITRNNVWIGGLNDLIKVAK